MMRKVQRLAVRRRPKRAEMRGINVEKKKRPVPVRFNEKVDIERSETFWNGTRCHEWIGSLDASGYGEIGIAYKTEKAHRVSWTLAKGRIPDGLAVLHHCDNRKFCNPEHLFLGTRADNVADMIGKKRQAVGRRRWNAKLSDEAVRYIRNSELSGRTLAEMHAVSPATISEVRTGKLWAHVD